MTEHDKRSVVNQFNVLHSYLDERYEELNVRQLRDLEVKAQEVWAILERRKEARRG